MKEWRELYWKIQDLRKDGKNDEAEKLKIELKEIQKENEREFWLGLNKPFSSPDDVPALPKPIKQYQTDILFKLGAIPKLKLDVGHYYLGKCRNASVAMWDGNVFWYMRTKFNYCFKEDINHFEDDNGFDLFVPIKQVEPDDYQKIK